MKNLKGLCVPCFSCFEVFEGVLRLSVITTLVSFEGFTVELSLAVLGVDIEVRGCVEGKVFAGVVCRSGEEEVPV